MWLTILYVSSGFTLAAFVAAVVAWSFKAQLHERERLIRAAPLEQRAALVGDALQYLRIDPGALGNKAQFELAMAQIQVSNENFRWKILLAGFLAFITAVVAVFAIYSNKGSAHPAPPPIASPAPVALPVASPLVAPVVTIQSSPDQTLPPITGPDANFTCEENAGSTIEYTAPPGFVIRNVIPSTANAAHTGTATAEILFRDARTVRAIARFRGINRNWVGNCEHGGQGAVRITVTIGAQ
jgi:hypothetical protein